MPTYAPSLIFAAAALALAAVAATLWSTMPPIPAGWRIIAGTAMGVVVAQPVLFFLAAILFLPNARRGGAAS